jgi:hypothetical protein
MLEQIINQGAQAGQQYAAGKHNVADARAYLTNPTNGVQTQAGQLLGAIISAYEQIKAQGQNSPAVIAAVVRSIEQVRSAFEAHVRSLGAEGTLFWGTAGKGAVDTINGLAAKLTADRQTELNQLTGGTAGAAGGAGAGVLGFMSSDDTTWLVVVAIALIVLIFFWRR